MFQSYVDFQHIKFSLVIKNFRNQKLTLQLRKCLSSVSRYYSCFTLSSSLKHYSPMNYQILKKKPGEVCIQLWQYFCYCGHCYTFVLLCIMMTFLYVELSSKIINKMNTIRRCHNDYEFYLRQTCKAFVKYNLKLASLLSTYSYILRKLSYQSSLKKAHFRRLVVILYFFFNNVCKSYLNCVRKQASQEFPKLQI